MLKKMTPKTLTLCAFGIALNIVGSNLALFLHLPLYLDTLGTMLCAALLGPLLGMLVGASTALFVGLTTDVFSLYYSRERCQKFFSSTMLCPSATPEVTI